MREETRVKLLTAAVLLMVFGAGFAVGLALDRSFAVAGTIEVSESAKADEQGDEPRSGGSIIDQLDLSEIQRVQVDSVLDEFQRRMSTFQREYRPRYWALVDSSRAEVRQLLNQEQALLHDSLTAESDRRRGRPGHSERPGASPRQ
jgi:Spy/CpxP family protein refolding chaperone